MKHKWNIDVDVYRCGWCGKIAPRNSSGRDQIFKTRNDRCPRISIEEKDIRDSLIDVEIEEWKKDDSVDLSPRARREIIRRYKGRSLTFALTAVAAINTLSTPIVWRNK